MFTEANQAKLTVVIPTLNEAGNIQELIQRISNAIPQVKIIVVDDGSNDGTQGIVNQLLLQNSNLKLIDRSKESRAC